MHHVLYSKLRGRQQETRLVSVGTIGGMSDAGPIAQSASGRLYAIDLAKGVGILLVVFGHAWRGAFDAGVLRDVALFQIIDQAIYAWHMPLFFFLSGLLFLEVLERTPPGPLLARRVRQLLWPFALWTWIFFGVKLLAGQAVNHPVTLADFPLIPLPPYEHLWFLWAMFLAQVVVMGLYLALRGVMAAQAFRLAFGIAAVALVLLIPWIGVPSPTFGAAVAHFPFFIAGIALGGVAHLRPPLWLASLSGVSFAVLLVMETRGGAALAVALCLTVLAWGVLARLDPGTERASALVRWLRYLGLYSLAIFLAHTIFSAAFRIALLKVGIDNLPVHLIVATAVGLAGPIVLVWISRRLGVAKVLGF